MSDMRKKIEEYITELEAEVIRCEHGIRLCKEIPCNQISKEKLLTRITTLNEVINDLRSRLDEVVD